MARQTKREQRQKAAARQKKHRESIKEAGGRTLKVTLGGEAAGQFRQIMEAVKAASPNTSQSEVVRLMIAKTYREAVDLAKAHTEGASVVDQQPEATAEDKRQSNMKSIEKALAVDFGIPYKP
ncbi:hypothetical protein [Pseudodesulfovibrio methanolicus]|uniref:Uncharacterized protein n=1 Tax=Pseudodesulfovibrio methanolicus TaxID=3126690 RepID=A0ABZ2IUR5_9BACT